MKNQHKGRLRLQLARQLYASKQKYLSLGLPDTPENRVIAAPFGLWGVEGVGFAIGRNQVNENRQSTPEEGCRR